jgi:glycosyltransferase involved in cell wall biosynthesis
MSAPHVVVVSQNVALEHDLRPRKEAETLAAAGYEVTLVGGSHAPARARDVVDARVRLQLYAQPAAGRGVAGQIREQGQALARALIGVIRSSRRAPIAALHVGNPPDNFFFVCKGLRGVQGSQPSFVFDQHDTTPLLLAAKHPGPRVTKHVLPVLRAMERRSFAAATLVVFANDAYRQRALREGLLRTDSEIVPNGFPLPAPSPHASWRNGTELIAYVGTIGEQDNVDHLVDAIAVLRNRRPLRVVVAGDGSALDTAKRRARELGVARAFEWLGFVTDRTRIAALVHDADVCVAPELDSEFNRHSTFVKIGEYMSAGAAIAAHRLPQTEALARDTVSYARDMSAEALAAAIEDLLEAPQRRRSLGQAATERFAAEISWDRVGGPRLAAAYERLFDPRVGR